MTNAPTTSSLLTPLMSSAAMRAVLDDRARLQHMLNVEVALARAEAALGVIPASCVDAIAEAAHAERYDIAALGQEAVESATVAVPFVKALTAEVAKDDAKAAGYVHWGATSQDILDTALVLELRAAVDALMSDLNRAIDAFVALSGKHRRTASVARTLLQHAVPMPFGLKLAGYAAALGRSRERLRRLRKEALVLQFGGAAGTLAALGDRGIEVSERLAALLDLPLPDAPWHTHRDRLAELASAFAILAGTCGKIARDVALLMQTDVAEAFEPAASGRGGSTTMPHKRNPVLATSALAAANMAPPLAASILAAQVQEHERALGGWQSEWPTFASLALVTSGALSGVADIAQGLEVDAERMRDNLATSRGLIMAEAMTFALAGKLGKSEARGIVDDAVRKAVAGKRELQDVIGEDARVKAHFSPPELSKLFDPMLYQGVAQTFIDRMIGSPALRGAKRS